MSDVETAQTGAEVAPVEGQQAVNQAPASDSTTEHGDAQRQDQPRDDKGRFVPQERVNEITRARREAERQLSSERQRAEALQRELESLRRSGPQVSNENLPSPEDYGYDLKAWGDAITRTVMSRAEQVAAERLNAYQAQNQHQQVARHFEERSRAYAAEHPEYQEKLADLDSAVQFPQEVLEVIAFSEHGPAIAHYLADHLDEADRLTRLPPHLAAVQLGRIEAQLSAPKPKPVTRAPDPAPVIGGGAAATKDPERMSTEDWMAWRRTQQ